jgi:hypothetical protein
VKTRRYALAESLAGRTDRLLLMTATPHSRDALGEMLSTGLSWAASRHSPVVQFVAAKTDAYEA